MSKYTVRVRVMMEIAVEVEAESVEDALETASCEDVFLVGSEPEFVSELHQNSWVVEDEDGNVLF